MTHSRVRFLRGKNILSDSTTLQKGQPVYDIDKHILRVGTGELGEETIANTPALSLEDDAILGNGTIGDSANSRKIVDIFENGAGSTTKNTVKNATTAVNTTAFVSENATLGNPEGLNYSFVWNKNLTSPSGIANGTEYNFTFFCHEYDEDNHVYTYAQFGGLKTEVSGVTVTLFYKRGTIWTKFYDSSVTPSWIHGEDYRCIYVFDFPTTPNFLSDYSDYGNSYYCDRKISNIFEQNSNYVKNATNAFYSITQPLGTNNTTIATTAFVKNAVEQTTGSKPVDWIKTDNSNPDDSSLQWENAPLSCNYSLIKFGKFRVANMYILTPGNMDGQGFFRIALAKEIFGKVQSIIVTPRDGIANSHPVLDYAEDICVRITYQSTQDAESVATIRKKTGNTTTNYDVCIIGYAD